MYPFGPQITPIPAPIVALSEPDGAKLQGYPGLGFPMTSPSFPAQRSMELGLDLTRVTGGISLAVAKDAS